MNTQKWRKRCDKWKCTKAAGTAVGERKCLCGVVQCQTCGGDLMKVLHCSVHIIDGADGPSE